MIALVHGKNTFLSYREAQGLFKNAQDDSRNYVASILNADSLEAETLVQEYQTGDMFSSGKTILLKRLYKNKARAEILDNLLEYLEHDPAGINLIIWEEQKIPANTKYLKFFKKADSNFEVQELNKRTFITWGKKEAESKGLTLTNDMVFLLTEDANYDPERFVNLLEKLLLKEKKDITKEDIKDVSINTYEYDVWQLIDTINGKRSDMNSIEVLSHLFDQRVEPLFIMAMLIRNTRMLIQIKSLLSEGADNRSLASKLRIPPFTVPTLVKSAQGVSEDHLIQIYRKLYSLDFQIKTGGIDAALGLTLLVSVM